MAGQAWKGSVLSVSPVFRRTSFLSWAKAGFNAAGLLRSLAARRQAKAEFNAAGLLWSLEHAGGKEVGHLAHFAKWQRKCLPR